METKKETKLISVLLDKKLYKDFNKVLLENDSDMTNTIRNFIKHYIKENQGE